MKLTDLVKQSLFFYRGTNIGVMLACAVGTAVLTGALLVGDSVRYSLDKTMHDRLGETHYVLVGNDRFFGADVSEKISEQLDVDAASVLETAGLVINNDADRRATNVKIYGVDDNFYKLADVNSPFNKAFFLPADGWPSAVLDNVLSADDIPDDVVVLNKPLAEKLKVDIGGEVLLRIARQSLMPRDIPLTPDSDLSVVLRLKVIDIADEDEFGRFSLQANQLWPLNAYIPLSVLAEKLSKPAMANMILIGGDGARDVSVDKVTKAFRDSWRFDDAGIDFRTEPGQKYVDMVSRRIFIDEPIIDAVQKSTGANLEFLTYFVNEITLGEKSTPYSMVTALTIDKDVALLSAELRDDEIMLSRWLADDLGAGSGDLVQLKYYVVGDGRKLIEKSTQFTVSGILPMSSDAVDSNLMPDFPGIADIDNCRDWEPGIPVDLKRIREKDEKYWDDYKGSPKAFVNINAGKKMWANRYGSATMLRFVLKDNDTNNSAVTKNAVMASLEQKLLENLDPASLGLFFQPVRQSGVKAGDEGTDFGQLFIGFSFFLIIAALVLMVMLFIFGVEKRAGQIGMLLAVGLPEKLVKVAVISEGALLAVIGSVIGSQLGLLYTRAMIFGLSTVWRTAVSSAGILFYAKWQTLIYGVLAGVMISVLSIWIAVHKLLRRPPRELLAGELKWQFLTIGKIPRGSGGFWLAGISAVIAAVLLIVMTTLESRALAGAFFAAGTLILVAGISTTSGFVTRISKGIKNPMTTIKGLGLRNTARRKGRSLAVVGLLASGIFLVVAIGVNRHNPLTDADKRYSGTGGFAMLGRSSIAVLEDLNDPSVRRKLGLDQDPMLGASIVQCRVYEGDDASCFNLNRAQKPSLLALDPGELVKRGSFTFVKVIDSASLADGWELLEQDFGDNVIPAVGDSATITWALGKSVGDSIEYIGDSGGKVKLLLVGMISNSIFQGSLVVPETKFIEHFRGIQGYKVFLVDAENEPEIVTDILEKQLRDFGVQMKSAPGTLAAFSAVENTYISIFQMMGGLGLILGSVGLGMVVLRNVLDRRGELAMLRAVGLRQEKLRYMIFWEHLVLLLCGLVVGLISAFLAVGPVLTQPGGDVPYLSVMLTIVAIAVSGVFWIWLACLLALKGPMIEPLRNE